MPPKLRLKIGLFAPSYAPNKIGIEQGIVIAKEAGFAIDCPDDLLDQPIAGCLWANSKEERARRIINMLNNPEIDAMWAVEGGESAVDVVNLLAQYHKNPEKIKRQIENSYKSSHKTLPQDFFLPERPDLYNYSQGALPKRGIPCIGFSDVSGINNFLGQNGLVSPYYADGFAFIKEDACEKVLKHLSGEKEISQYNGLKLLAGEDFVSAEDLQIYATVDGWISLSCGTDFQFALQNPSILAIESIEETNMVGFSLQQAFEAGALTNVKAIVIGRTKDGQVADDLEKYPALKEFVEKSKIPVFTTNGNLETGENTFGHGSGGITEPFANFAAADLTKQKDGRYSLKISGSRSKEDLDSAYQSETSHAKSAEIFPSQKETVGDISIDPQDLQLLSGNVVDLSGLEIISANFKEIYRTNGTAKQIDAKDKVVLISGNEKTDFLHQALVGNHLSGAFEGAKAIIVAVPPYAEKTMIETLQIFTDASCEYVKGEDVEGLETYSLAGFPKAAFDNRLKHDLDKIEKGLISYDTKPNEDGSVDVKIIILNKEKIIERNKEYEKRKADTFKEMLADAARTHFPETSLYFVEDEKLVREQEMGIQVGELLLENAREKDLALNDKLGSASKEVHFSDNYMKISDRFYLEKKLSAALHGQFVDDGKNKLIISDQEVFYGEVDENGRRKFGILKLQQPYGELPPGAVFIGTFSQDQRPLSGEFRAPGIICKISPLADGRFELTETFVEGGAVVKSTCGKDLTDIKRPPYDFKEPTRSILPQNPEELFAPTKDNFYKLRAKQSAVFEAVDTEAKAMLMPLRTRLENRELLYGDTMLSELTGRVSAEQQAAHQHLRNGIINRRIDERKKDPTQEGYGSGDKYGNCLQYSQQTQKLAAENGLENTFILFGRPDHVFNVTVLDDGKMFLIDSWNGDLMCEFNAENFYQHSSLHAIFDLTINHNSWAEKGGCLDAKSTSVIAAKQKLESRIQEIADARFSPKIQDVMRGRIAKKLKTLDPRDAYYQENKQELQFVADHFGLEDLHEKLISPITATAAADPAKASQAHTPSTSPLIIYVAENDHGDMSYGSLMEQIIKDCQAKGLSVKTFSEFPSQSLKSQRQTPRIPELMNLQNSRESVEATAQFLDGQFIQMGDLQNRNSRYDATWNSLLEDLTPVTPEQLVKLLEDNVDNPELLKAMKNDLVAGEISGKDQIGNLKNFYDYWRNPLHYKQTHELMAKDVMDNLTTLGTPDVVIIVAGSPHLIGIDQQLTVKSSQKIVVGNHPQGLDPLSNLIFSGTPEICAGIADSVGFEVDLKKQAALVPAIVKEMIDEKSQSKIIADGLDLSAKKEGEYLWTTKVGGSKVAEIASQENGWEKHLDRNSVATRPATR